MRTTIQGCRRACAKPAFLRFWLGMMISRTGDAFTTVALSWLVLTIAGPAELGIVLLCFGLPRLVAGPVAGRLLDRFQPRILLGWDNAARGVLIASLPLLDHLGDLRMGHVYLVALACAALSSLTEVAEGALVPRLVEDENLEPANSLLSMNWELAYIVGPPAAGVVVASLGVTSALLVDAATFVGMSLLCFRLPRLTARPPDTERRGVLQDWLGFGALFRVPSAVVLTACSAGFLFLGGVTEVLFPVYSRDVLGSGAVAYGLVLGAAGVGALCGVLFGVPLLRDLPPHLKVGLVLLAGGAVFTLLAITTSTPMAVGIVAVASFCCGPFYAIERTLFQRQVPDEVRGQVVGARISLCSLGFPLGSAAGGFLLAGIGATTAVLLLAFLFALLALLPLLARSLRLPE